MAGKSKLPSNQKKKAEVLRELFISLNSEKSVRARFRVMTEKTGLSLSQLKRHYKNYNWKLLIKEPKKITKEPKKAKKTEPKKPISYKKPPRLKTNTGEGKEAKKEIIQRALDIEGNEEYYSAVKMKIKIEPGRQYSEQEEEEVGTEICYWYSIGLFALERLTRIAGISYSIFWKWYRDNPELKRKYEEAKVQHDSSSYHIIEERLREWLTKQIEKPFNEEWRKNFIYKTEFNPDTQTLERMRILVSETQILRSIKLDAPVLAFYMQSLRELRTEAQAGLQRIENVNIQINYGKENVKTDERGNTME